MILGKASSLLGRVMTTAAWNLNRPLQVRDFFKGLCRYIRTGVPPAMVSSSGMCAKRIVVDTCHHMLGRLSSIIAKELLNDQKVVVVRSEQIYVSSGLVRQ
jgi:hypothetical protein